MVGNLYNLEIGYDFPIMQYIRLNGAVEIKLYEIDLVKINTERFHDIENCLIFEIIYRRSSFALKCLNSEKMFGLFSALLASRLGIIGNIFRSRVFKFFHI